MADFDLSNFSFSFDPNLEIFGGSEPLSMDDVPGADPGVFLPNTEGRTEFLPPDPSRIPVIENAVKHDSPEYLARPAEERTSELLAQMAPHRQVLLGVLRAADKPISDEDMAQVIAKLREHKYSVYAPSNICTMLEKAGALERVREDGSPYGNYEPKPSIVVIDGEEYYAPTDPPTIYWQVSEAGRNILATDKPLDRLSELLENERSFKHLYKRVLTLAARDEGVTMSQLSTAVDSDPSIAEPRRFFIQHFVESLECCEALAWQGETWKITQIGREALNGLLANVDDDHAFDEQPDNGGIATETQGINW